MFGLGHLPAAFKFQPDSSFCARMCDDSHSELSLADNGLTGSMPTGISACKGLTYVRAEKLKFWPQPASTAQYSGSQARSRCLADVFHRGLWIDDNQLTGPALDTLTKLTQLVYVLASFLLQHTCAVIVYPHGTGLF